MLGTIEDVVDELRDRGERVGALAIRCFRPYPADEVRAALAGARRVVVVEKAFAVGLGGIVGQNVRLALAGLPVEVHDVVAGLGGRPITSASLERLLDDGARRAPGRADVPRPARRHRRARAGTAPRRARSGPHAENMLRDIGVIASGAV